MHILVLTQFFPPEMGAPAGRFYDFAQRWLASGHRVTVVTGFPNFPGGEIHAGYRGRLFETENLDGIPVKRGFILTGNRRFLGRPTAYATFLASSGLRVLFDRLDPYDCVVATSPPPSVGLPGLLAARRRGVPLVFDLRDIWPEAIVNSGRLSNPALIALFEQIARLLYRRSARVVTVTAGQKARLVELGVPASKVHVVANGIDLPTFDASARRALPPAFDGLDPGARWLTYAGIFNTPQGLDFVLEAMARLRACDPGAYGRVQLVLVGEGPQERALRAQRERLRLERVVFLPRQPREAVFSLLPRSFAVLVTLRPRRDTSTVPSKLYESLASGRPVLYQGAGEGADLVRQAGGGIVCPAGDPDALCDAVRAYLRDPAQADADGARGRDFVAGHFDRRALADRYLALLGGVLDAGR